MTITEKREWLDSQIGKATLDGVEDDGYEFYFNALYEYGISYSDADGWGWLNTLFGYDIGHEAALAIIKYQYETDGDDVMEFGYNDKEDLENIDNELGLNLDFSNFVKKTPTAIKFFGGN